MSSNPAIRKRHEHANGWMTVLALGLLGVSLLACMYVLVGFPAQAQARDLITQAHAQVGQAPASATAPDTLGAPAALPAARRPPISFEPYLPVRRRIVPVYITQAPAAPVQAPANLPHAEALAADLQNQLNTVRDQLTQSRELMRESAQSQHRTRVASALFLLIFAVIAALIVIQVYIQARGWDREASQAGEELEALKKQVEALRDTGSEFRDVLPAMLQEVGEQPLSYQEEGTAFAPRAFTMIEDIDHLAYVGQGRLAFRDLPANAHAEAAVYLNGLLLSAVAHLSRTDPWPAFSRLDQFFSHLSRFPDALERLRVAQGYSYRALAAYQVLESQHKEPSWLRKAERSQLETLSRQAFSDVAQSATIDPEWKHSTFVEALLCGRFYIAEESGAESNAHSELVVRGLRRAVSLYKSLIDEHAYRGPSRRNLIRALKQIAEQTGEKSDFSDFGYALNAFPTDEELADEALAARQPNSQDRFLWQWLMGDEELFGHVDQLNLAEYRAFWIRMLDNKVHLRNWRSDLMELQQANPAMKDWSIQLLQMDPPLSLSSAIARRLERYESPASNA